MIETLLVLGVIAAIVTLILLHPVLLNWQRYRLKQRPFPPRWKAVVEQSLPFYFHLSLEQRKRLQGHIRVLLAEK